MALTVVVFTSVPAFGQLTAEDIEDIKQRAKEEGWSFTVGWTPACQYTLEELCGFDPTLAPADDAKVMDPITLSAKDLPARFDWRDSTTLPPARDQGGCGSCWAFATVGPLECLIKLKNDETVNLSEQWLVSCNPWGFDCDGGFTIPQMFLSSGDPCGDAGAVMEADFPYTQTNGECQCPYDHFYWIESYTTVNSSELGLKNAIYEYGPIMVSVHVDDDPWYAYTGGVFDACGSGPTNHAVVLVGWDDNQGDHGVWFMRNSWGTIWGEDGGYMRIPYGCNSIGSNAKRVYYQPIFMTASQTLGTLPLTVDFVAEAPRDSIVQCDWAFGDGDWGSGDTITHVYDQTGVFSVELEVQTPHGTMAENYPSLIAVHADTMRMPEVTGAAGTPVRIDVSLRNFLELDRITIPFTWDGPMELEQDSISVVGCRTDYFEKTYLHYHEFTKRATIQLSCPSGQPFLSPGMGEVVSLWFTIPAGAQSGTNPIEFHNYSSFETKVSCAAGDYTPTLEDGLVEIPAGCCQGPSVGNVDNSPDNAVSLGDLTALIDHLFISLTPVACITEADIDLSGQPNPGPDDVTLGDLTLLVDHLFISLSPLAPCP
ncbi:PKD domain-containing protein [candidate division GN15 bacterium]|nr:PKD domain-containing protein [candidate division GN15 bacterium]